MPAFLFHCPRFPRLGRSRSGKPSPLVTHDDTATLNAPLPSSSRPSSRIYVLEQDVNPAANASRSLAPQTSRDRQHVAGLLGDGVPLSTVSLVPQTQPPTRTSNIAGLNPSQVHNLQDSITQPRAQLSCPLNPMSSEIIPESMQLVNSPRSLATSSQRSLDFQNFTGSSSQFSTQSQQQGQRILDHAHDFTMIAPTFIESNVNIATSSQFMKDLLKETIPGAAFDSSSRYPPPRCHPGTRLAILDRCLQFIATCNGVKKMRWVVGAAGVGKSAILQNVAESPNLAVTCHASVFFSINGRYDGAKAITTMSYQFAAKSKAYRQLIEREITQDPSLLQSSMPVQFNKFIVEPFIHHPQLSAAGRVLIIIDGLDECNNLGTQQELLHLISEFCLQYPSSPIIWLIASRPEPHITSFFSRHKVIPAFEQEEIPVNSDEARADVERYLRDELTEIKEASDSLDPEWPEERDLWKLASAAGGLFAYAQTAIRYIGDSAVGSPASQFSDVLNVIDNHMMKGVAREDHPLASLDALYARVLSNVPPKIMINTRKLLLALASDWGVYTKGRQNFVLLCNWLGMTIDEAYAALNHLRSVLSVPKREQAHQKELQPFHKSFIDYVSDFTRSGFSRDIKIEGRQLKYECAFRILVEAPDGVDVGDMDYELFFFGTLMRVPGTTDKISLTWLVDSKSDWSDDETRLQMYKVAVTEVTTGVKRRDAIVQTESSIRLLTTRFQSYEGTFPYFQLRDLVFGVESLRDVYMKQGIIKGMPLSLIDASKILAYDIKFQFYRPVTTDALSDPWHRSCNHQRQGEWEEGMDQQWVTSFHGNDHVPSGMSQAKWCNSCDFCASRFERHLESSIIRSPDLSVPTLFTSTGAYVVELRILDPEDGISEWTYWFWCRGKEQ